MPTKLKNELQRSDDLIGHDVSGTESVSLNSRPKLKNWQEELLKEFSNWYLDFANLYGKFPDYIEINDWWLSKLNKTEAEAERRGREEMLANIAKDEGWEESFKHYQSKYLK